MKERLTYKEILQMVKSACSQTFYHGSKGITETVLKCATEIYIAQMKEDKAGEQEWLDT